MKYTSYWSRICSHLSMPWCCGTGCVNGARGMTAWPEGTGVLFPTNSKGPVSADVKVLQSWRLHHLSDRKRGEELHFLRNNLGPERTLPAEAGGAELADIFSTSPLDAAV